LEIKEYELQPQNVVRAVVAISADEFENAVNSVYLKQRGQIRLPGFRKGKVPRKMIEKMYGEDVFYNEAVNSKCNEALDFVVKEKELKPATQSWIDKAEKNPETGEMEIIMFIPNYPIVDIPTYKGLQAVRDEPTVTDEEINERIEQIRKRNSSVKTVERAAQMGDTVVIDFVGYTNNIPFPGGKSENHYLELGSKSFVGNFEEQLVGAKAGDDLEVNVTFPFDYNSEELRDKDAVFKVHVQEVKEPTLPELDDDFAQDVSEFETFEEFKQSVRDELLKSKTDVVRDDFYDKIMEQLLETTTIDLHDKLIDDKVEQLLLRQSANFGMTYEVYRKMFDTQSDEIKNALRERAIHDIRIELILREIADREKLEVTDEDREREYDKLAETYGVDAETIKTASFVNHDTIENGILFRKIADFLIDNSIALKNEEYTA